MRDRAMVDGGSREVIIELFSRRTAPEWDNKPAIKGSHRWIEGPTVGGHHPTHRNRTADRGPWPGAPRIRFRFTAKSDKSASVARSTALTGKLKIYLLFRHGRPLCALFAYVLRCAVVQSRKPPGGIEPGIRPPPCDGCRNCNCGFGQPAPRCAVCRARGMD